MTIDPTQLRDFASRYTAAWCSQDPTSVASFFSPNGTLSVNGVPAIGRDAITQVAEGFMSAFPDMVLTMDDVLIDCDNAVYHWTLDGHNPGPGGAGNRVRISGFEEWTFGADGLVAESQGHFDEIEYQRQIKCGFAESQH